MEKCAQHLTLAALLLIAPIGLQAVEGCVCDANPPCAAAGRADAVFVGTMVNQTLEPLSGPLTWSSPIQRLVPARGCALVYFSLITNGRIEGHVVQEDGTPVPRVFVDVIPADLPPNQQPDDPTAPSASTDEKGRFAVDARPVPDAFVTAAPVDHPRMTSSSRTDSTGVFQLRVFSGVTYVFKASDRPGDGSRQAETVVVVDQQTEGIRLSIPR